MTTFKALHITVAIIIAISCSGCAGLGRGGSSANSSEETRKISVLRNQEYLEGTKFEKFIISRKKLRESFQKPEALTRARIIQTASRSGELGSEFPEYRLFSIIAGDPYALLGLKNGDVLIAANDYLLANPDVFRRYVALLGGEEQARVEVRRGGQPLVLQYSFVD